MKPRILIVDDEPDALELLRFHLEGGGYRVVSARDGREALQKIQRTTPDLVVLDWLLPGMSGLELCKQLRREPATASLPIIMLTAKSAEVDRVVGLEIGVDDYVTKPFSPRELVLRIQKQLKHKLGEPEAETYQFGSVTIDVTKHQVIVDGAPVKLTTTEFKLLQTLAARRGRLQTRAQLLQDVWDFEKGINSRTVDTHMRRLRQKLGDSARFLESVRGFGYRLADE